MSSESAVECAEVSGKIVKTLKIHQDPADGTEVHIDFTDGTSLSVSVMNQQKTDARLLLCGGPGEPELLQKYGSD